MYSNYREQYKLVLDGILSEEFLKGPQGRDLRTQALVRVLQSIPEVEYRILREKFTRDIRIDIPKRRLLGVVQNTEGLRAMMVLYPNLEDKPFSEVLRVVGHELGHCLLHDDFLPGRVKDNLEKQADLQCLLWGF